MMLLLIYLDVYFWENQLVGYIVRLGFNLGLVDVQLDFLWVGYFVRCVLLYYLNYY